CMSWVTSPAAAELEERMMQWLRQMLGLPAGWDGVIQDTASTATLCSLLTAREVRSGFAVNSRGFTGDQRYSVYCSSEAHSSIEKGVKIAGIGRDNLRIIPVDDAFAMDPAALERAVVADRARGLTPLAVVAAFGTTGSTAVDPLAAIGEICARHHLWLHIDAAYAGTALLLPEYRELVKGIEQADTFVFNPHKWMFTNFDCSAYFVKDRDALVRTFEILPEYLKTHEREAVNNYRDWGIQLGRRFRALKLWFVIRTYGVEGLKERLRSQIGMARCLEERMRQEPGVELLAPRLFTVLCFRWHPAGLDDELRLNELNMALMERLNATGDLYISHTRLNGRVALRFVISQTTVEQRHVDRAWEVIRREAAALSTTHPSSL
ncbi:MAG TPA: pyridoxal-dependent decarboxylase, partial [Bacteroidota bacterium]